MSDAERLSRGPLLTVNFIEVETGYELAEAFSPDELHGGGGVLERLTELRKIHGEHGVFPSFFVDEEGIALLGLFVTIQERGATGA